MLVSVKDRELVGKGLIKFGTLSAIYRSLVEQAESLDSAHSLWYVCRCAISV